jgi:hypothetical protein
MPRMLLKMDRKKIQLIFASLFFCMVVYPWINSPIYPDEVAYRLSAARYIADNGKYYGNWILCEYSLKNEYPYVLVVPAYVYSLLDGVLDYYNSRIIPAFCLWLMIYACHRCVNQEDSTFGYFSIFATFCGVAPSTLIWARPEAAHILNICVCIFVGCRQGKQWSLVTSQSASALVLITFLMSVWPNPQGLLFAPLNIFCLYLANKRESSEKRWPLGTFWLILTAISFIYAFMWGFDKCKNYSQISSYMASMTSSFDKLFDPAISALNHIRAQYINSFTFKNEFPSGYLPGVDKSIFAISATNLMTKIIVYINLFSCLIMGFYELISVDLTVFRDKNFPIKSDHRYRAIRLRALAVLISAPALVSIVLDAQSAMYRAFFINACLSVAVTLWILSLPVKTNLIIRVALVCYATLALAVAGASAYISNAYILPKIYSGYSGPSISNVTEWKRVGQSFNEITRGFEDRLNEGSIIVDDLTYIFLRHHRRLIPITYLGLQSEIIGVRVADGIALSRANLDEKKIP